MEKQIGGEIDYSTIDYSKLTKQDHSRIDINQINVAKYTQDYLQSEKNKLLEKISKKSSEELNTILQKLKNENCYDKIIEQLCCVNILSKLKNSFEEDSGYYGITVRHGFKVIHEKVTTLLNQHNNDSLGIKKNSWQKYVKNALQRLQEGYSPDDNVRSAWSCYWFQYFDTYKDTFDYSKLNYSVLTEEDYRKLNYTRADRSKLDVNKLDVKKYLSDHLPSERAKALKMISEKGSDDLKAILDKLKNEDQTCYDNIIDQLCCVNILRQLKSSLEEYNDYYRSYSVRSGVEKKHAEISQFLKEKKDDNLGIEKNSWQKYVVGALQGFQENYSPELYVDSAWTRYWFQHYEDCKEKINYSKLKYSKLTKGDYHKLDYTKVKISKIDISQLDIEKYWSDHFKIEKNDFSNTIQLNGSGDLKSVLEKLKEEDSVRYDAIFNKICIHRILCKLKKAIEQLEPSSQEKNKDKQVKLVQVNGSIEKNKKKLLGSEDDCWKKYVAKALLAFCNQKSPKSNIAKAWTRYWFQDFKKYKREIDYSKVCCSVLTKDDYKKVDYTQIKFNEVDILKLDVEQYLEAYSPHAKVDFLNKILDARDKHGLFGLVQKLHAEDQEFYNKMLKKFCSIIVLNKLKQNIEVHGSFTYIRSIIDTRIGKTIEDEITSLKNGFKEKHTAVDELIKQKHKQEISADEESWQNHVANAIIVFYGPTKNKVIDCVKKARIQYYFQHIRTLICDHENVLINNIELAIAECDKPYNDLMKVITDNTYYLDEKKFCWQDTNEKYVDAKRVYDQSVSNAKNCVLNISNSSLKTLALSYIECYIAYNYPNSNAEHYYDYVCRGGDILPKLQKAYETAKKVLSPVSMTSVTAIHFNNGSASIPKDDTLESTLRTKESQTHSDTIEPK